MSDLETRIKEAEAKGEVIDLSNMAAPKEEHLKLPGYSIHGINLNKVQYFTPKVFKALPKDKWPVFHYKPKTGVPWQIEVLDNFPAVNTNGEILLADVSPETLKILFQRTVFLLKKGLVGWSNFLDEDGDPIPFVKDAQGEPTEETIAAIDTLVAMEIASAISESLKLTKEERHGLKL